MSRRSIRNAAALVLLAIVFSCSPPRRPENPTGPHFKIMTWNINFGGPGPDLVPKTILEEDPDIVCLQETTPAWERFLRPRLEDRYPFVRFHHSRGAGGLAFFSKFPMAEKSLDASPVGWFPAWTVIAETPRLHRDRAGASSSSSRTVGNSKR